MFYRFVAFLMMCYSSLCFAANPSAQGTIYNIGDYAQGGVVFWLTPDRTHGLVAAIADQSSGVAWATGSSAGSVTSTSDSLSVGFPASAGKLNAEVILNRTGITSSAAELCANYQGGGYTDWYLPNIIELTALYSQAAVVNTTAIANGGSAFASSIYWTSVQTSSGVGNIDFSSGRHQFFTESNTFHVRAIRAF
jgi:hypothetical protein